MRGQRSIPRRSHPIRQRKGGTTEPTRNGKNVRGKRMVRIGMLLLLLSFLLRCLEQVLFLELLLFDEQSLKRGELRLGFCEQRLLNLILLSLGHHFLIVDVERFELLVVLCPSGQS